MSIIYISNSTAVAVFGMVLSAAFCDIRWTRKKGLLMAGCMTILLIFQGIIYFWVDSDIIEYIYPLIMHFPLTVVLCLLNRKILWPTISVLTAYLCCQIRRWQALFFITVFAGGSVMQNTIELVMTLPILLILLRFVAPSVRSVSHNAASIQIRFGVVPALYYGFDYLACIYTKLLLEGVLVAVEFMPFVCSVTYLVFVVRASAEGRLRSRLEQMQEILNLQVAQAVREIGTLREFQQKTRAYRHDLRHHMQYLLSCIENGRFEQAQGYIREICSEIEANQLITFCENEAANLIFSAFTGRAKDCGVSMKIQAVLPHNIAVSESDLCVLLSNALENALHACQKRKEKGLSGTIEVSAYEKKGRFFLQIVNSCGGNIVFDHGIPVTRNPGHGIGVRSICAIVEKYDGIYSFSVKDDKFILRVSFEGHCRLDAFAGRFVT